MTYLEQLRIVFFCRSISVTQLRLHSCIVHHIGFHQLTTLVHYHDFWLHFNSSTDSFAGTSRCDNSQDTTGNEEEYFYTHKWANQSVVRGRVVDTVVFCWYPPVIPVTQTKLNLIIEWCPISFPQQTPMHMQACNQKLRLSEWSFIWSPE